MKRVAVIFILALMTSLCFAQGGVVRLFDLLKDEQTSDDAKIAINRELQDSILALVSKSTRVGESYVDLPNLGRAVATDGSMCIYSWGFPLSDGSYHYGCVFQSKSKNKLFATPVTIKNRAYTPRHDVKVSRDNWYGALYYAAVPVKFKRELYYVLLGWAGSSASTHAKVIEAVKLDSKGRPTFGRLVFKKLGRAPWMRHVLSYSAEGKIALNYDPQNQCIVFDHLSPESVMFTDIYSYYGPDFTYDSYILKEGKWYYMEDVDAKNKE